MITTTRRGIGLGILLALIPLGVGVAGCGGGGGSASVAPAPTGRAIISVEWPSHSTSRLIPAATGSLRVNFLSGTTTLRTALITRQEGAAATRTELDLPAGSLTVQADALPTLDGSGIAVASAQVPVTIVAGQRTPINLTLASTIARVTILPEEIPFSTEPVPVSAVAYDARGQVVITSSWQWSVVPDGIISIVASGATATLQAQAEGTATITIRETESGRTFNKTVIVVPPEQF